MIEIKDLRPSLETKVHFLACAQAYPGYAGAVEARQTHMSWVFLTADRVYKLKKPVRFAYLDFSTLARREAACRAELEINRRLAPGIYLDVVPLTASAAGLAIGGDGDIVDWLIVMRRLDEAQMLDRAIAERRVSNADLNRLIARLVTFYRHAEHVFVSPQVYFGNWRRTMADDHAVLRQARFDLPVGLVDHIFHVQRRFLAERRALFNKRVRGHHIVDGHGDLKPEHIWLGRPIRIIDRLEFDLRLRRVDPFDEAAYLSLECERLGAPAVGARIERGLLRALRNGPSEQLFAFYRCRRATLRARLAIAHLAEPDGRTPERWRPMALAYLRLAWAEAKRLEGFLRMPEGPQSAARNAAGSKPRRKAARRPGRRASP